MVVEQDYLYWALMEQLVVKQKYRILALSQDGQEALLEPFRNKQFTLVRLKRIDVDWGNTLTIDIEQASQKFKQLLHNGVKGPIRIMNIYVSSLPPVDDLPDAFHKGYSELNGKIDITSALLVKNECEEGLKRVEGVLNVQLEHIHKQFKPNIELQDIHDIRNRVIHYHNEQRETERKLFQNGKPFFTYIFLGLQIFMFLLLELFGGSTNTETLIRFGAKFNPLIYEGEWWRFLTPIVLHIGFLHLLMNSVSLYYIGSIVERSYGTLRFLFVYLVAGISGTVASFAFSPSVSAGASGAIFGCFGALLYIGVQNKKVFFQTMGSSILMIIGINLAMGFVIPNIDNAGHIGGLIGGFLAACIVQLPKQKKLLLRIAGLAAAILLMAGVYRYGIGHAKDQYSEYTILKGQELIRAEQYEEAYSYLQEAIHDVESSNDHLFLFSVAEIELKKYDQAIQHLQQIIAIDDTYHQAHYNLAILYAEAGDIELAKEEAGKALEHDPANEMYQAFWDKLIQMN